MHIRCKISTYVTILHSFDTVISIFIISSIFTKHYDYMISPNAVIVFKLFTKM